MITYIAGNIGAGKSAYSVKLARKALLQGRQVYSTDYIEGCYKLDISWLCDYCCPRDSLLIIDESALKFNSRDFASLSKHLLAYFKLSRHYHNDIILISQTFGDTDKQIRELAQRVLFIRKIGCFSMPVKVKGDIAIGDDGQPCVKYKIGRLGVPFVPRLQGSFYNSWNGERKECPREAWDTVPQKWDVWRVLAVPLGDLFRAVSRRIKR